MKKLLILAFILILSAAVVSCKKAQTESTDEAAPSTPDEAFSEQKPETGTVSHFGITCELPEGFEKSDEKEDYVTYCNAETESTIDFAAFDKESVPSTLTKSNVSEWFSAEDCENVLSVSELLFDGYNCSRVKMKEMIDGVSVYSEQTVVFFDDHVVFLTVATPENSDFYGQISAFYDNVHIE